jgi:DNA-binding MarR family transcriptional regulator
MDESNRRQFESAKRASLSHQLVRAARLLRARSLRMLREHPQYAHVREAHLNLMPHLDLEGTRLTDLAVRMDVSKQAVGPLVDELVQWGYLERVPDPADGRARLVRFTGAGEEGLRDGVRSLQQLDAALDGALSPDELSQLLTLLERVLERLEG